MGMRRLVRLCRILRRSLRLARNESARLLQWGNRRDNPPEKLPWRHGRQIAVWAASDVVTGGQRGCRSARIAQHFAAPGSARR